MDIMEVLDLVGSKNLVFALSIRPRLSQIALLHICIYRNSREDISTLALKHMEYLSGQIETHPERSLKGSWKNSTFELQWARTSGRPSFEDSWGAHLGFLRVPREHHVKWGLQDAQLWSPATETRHPWTTGCPERRPGGAQAKISQVFSLHASPREPGVTPVSSGSVWTKS